MQIGDKIKTIYGPDNNIRIVFSKFLVSSNEGIPDILERNSREICECAGGLRCNLWNVDIFSIIL